MYMRRDTRLTNAHSKKFENHCHIVSLYTVWYNFVRINSTVKMSPTMAAGVPQDAVDDERHRRPDRCGGPGSQATRSLQEARGP